LNRANVRDGEAQAREALGPFYQQMCDRIGAERQLAAHDKRGGDGPLPEVMTIFSSRKLGYLFQSAVASVEGRCHDQSGATRYFTKA
jgi:hypothetical protein